jgi:hypothetical protein
MMNLYFSTQRDDGTKIYLCPLSSRRQACCAEPIEDASGYFLFEERVHGPFVEIEILARVDTDEAAIKLSRIFGMN